MGDYRWGVSRACRDAPLIQVAKYSITVKVMVALVDPSDKGKRASKRCCTPTQASGDSERLARLGLVAGSIKSKHRVSIVGRAKAGLRGSVVEVTGRGEKRGRCHGRHAELRTES
jgi:hypothetical protein